jgi:hypothetical protein
VIRVRELLVPVVAAMREELLVGGYIQADERPVAVQMHDARTRLVVAVQSSPGQRGL